MIKSRGMPHEEPQLFSDAEESDTRIRIHALNASDTTITESRYRCVPYWGTTSCTHKS